MAHIKLTVHLHSCLQNYDNNNTPAGKPKPGTNNVDYEQSTCRKTFWHQSPSTAAAASPKCACTTGCICRSQVGTVGRKYVTGWMTSGGNSCITHLGAQPKYDLFFQCRPSQGVMAIGHR